MLASSLAELYPPNEHSVQLCCFLRKWKMVLRANVLSKRRSGGCQLNFPTYSLKLCDMILSIKLFIKSFMPAHVQGK